MRIGKRLEVIGKQWATLILGKILDNRNQVLDPPSLGDIKSVLFVRPNFRMGNMLLLTPAISAARHSIPEAHIGLLTTTTYADMLNDQSDLDEVHVLTRGMTWKWWQLLRLVCGIRSRRYDLVVDCSEGESLLGSVFIAFSRARFRLGLAGSKQEAVFNLRATIRGSSKHRIVRLLELLKYVGIRAKTHSMRLDLDETALAWAAGQWSQWNLGRETPVVGINIGARGDKRWPLHCFVSLMNGLINKKYQVILFAGPQELDRLEKLDKQLPSEVIIDTTDVPSRFAALIKSCSVFVTGDTGPMHLSVAVGTPTVSIFLKSNFEEYGPLGSSNRVVFDPRGRKGSTALSAIMALIGQRQSYHRARSDSRELLVL